MSTKSPPVSNIPSMSRVLRPLSMTCVSPTWRGLPGRAGTPSHPSLKPGIELLQFLRRTSLNVVIERVAVGVDADDQRPEVLDTELPQAFRHQVLPGNLLDLLDLCRLERSRAADDCEVDHAEPVHRLDRVVGESALAADRPDPVLGSESLREADHAGARGRADADLLVATRSELADVRRRVQQEGAGEVHRRLDALVEDPDLRAVADADDVALHGDLVAGAQLQDLGGVRDREGDLVARHQNSLSYSTEPSAARCAVARRPAQHW